MLQFQTKKSKQINQFSQPTYISNRIKNFELQKGILIIILFILFILYRVLYTHEVKKMYIYDTLHEISFQLNRWIKNHVQNVFIGIGQVIMDVFIWTVLIYWIVFVKNFRFPATFAFFFYCRQFIQHADTMPYPSYQVWQSPGFPSIMVPYDKTADYFYSGHTGSVVVFCLELFKLNVHFGVKIIAFTAAAYIMFMLIILRVHYTIDVIGACIYAMFFYQFVSNYIQSFDRVFNAPFALANIIKQKVVKTYESQRTQSTSLYDIQHQ